jgi:hypothetical protein
LTNIFLSVNFHNLCFSFSAALTEEANKLDQATGGGDDDSRIASATASTVNNDQEDEDEDDEDEDEEVQIDEDLFADDLEDIEEQLRETNLTS